MNQEQINTLLEQEKPVVVKKQPGMGIVSSFTTSVQDKNQDTFDLTASNFIQHSFLEVSGKHLVEHTLFPQQDKPFVIFVHDLETLTQHKQKEFFDLTLEQSKKTNSQVLIFVSDFEKVNPEVLEKSFLFVPFIEHSQQITETAVSKIESLRKNFHPETDTSHKLKNN